MDLETAPGQNEVKESPHPAPFPKPWWGRVLYGVFITAIPVLSFWAIQVFKPEWQSGELSDYIILLLFPEASLLFFPLLAYSIICYLLIMAVPARYSSSPFVRLGVYTGVLLALQYGVALIVWLPNLLFNYTYILLWILPIVFLKVYRWAANKWNARTVNIVLASLIATAYLAIALIVRHPLGPLFYCLIALVMAGPFWSFLLAVQAAIWLIKNYETKITRLHGLGLAAWLTLYLTALRFDILKMHELYAALPPTPPPDCYIATAAAHGHPRFVGSRAVQRADGQYMRVNAQLQGLKSAELALLAAAPGLHKPLRRIYDILGKALARGITLPLMADVAYVLLKPFEWVAVHILRILIPDINSISTKLYCK